ncbi:MAG: GNAT family N-acetyltransferase [Planctomycetota bacterium]|jgi:ribosomal protein S18 acetylase RimI-like enzyme
MAEFAPYRPDEHGRPAEDLRVRAAGHRDVDPVARLIADRERAAIDSTLASVRDEIDRIEDGTARKHLCIASIDGTVVGFGRVTHLPAEEIDGAWGLPSAWYLTGIVVAPEWRRRGVARAITAHRLKWVRRRASAVYYYANLRNRASIALHAGFGFRELTRDFGFPGLAFAGGAGALFGLDLGAAD